MGAVNYAMSDYITLALNTNAVEDTDTQEYLFSVAENIIADYGFYYFHVVLKSGYYNGFSVDIENNFPVAFDWYQEKQDAQKEITQLKKCLLQLCGRVGMVETFPGWCTGYSDAAETKEAIKKAVLTMRQDVHETPTWVQYNRGVNTYA